MFRDREFVGQVLHDHLLDPVSGERLEHEGENSVAIRAQKEEEREEETIHLKSKQARVGCGTRVR